MVTKQSRDAAAFSDNRAGASPTALQYGGAVPISDSRAVERLYRGAPCVFLDCDGVIFDSNGFKLDALRHTLAGYPAHAVREMEAYWCTHGGVSRYEKLGHFFSQILRIGEVSAEVAAAALRFSEFSRRAYGERSPVPEALLFARATGAGRCFVVSGTDQEELRDVFVDKQLSALFAQVCGSPTSKLDHVHRILQEHDCPSERALFIGDGGGDFDVARKLGVPFIYLDEYSEWRAAKATLTGVKDVLVCDTWREILALVGLPSADDAHGRSGAS